MGWEVLYFSSFKSNSRGVAILFHKNFDGTVSDPKKDPAGNYLMLEVTVKEQMFLLCCIYGPSATDNPDFFENVDSCIDEFN